ncbi:MAG: TonB-dependent receptor family protein [Crocinitomicaceae bacterium]|nr:TonB-dependent receptor family protein [Crocinitomicaceae bacterium]
MLNKLFIAFTFVILSQFSFGQKMQISGVVQDTNGVVLPNTLATAVRVKDSLLLEFARTDENGKFELKTIQMDTFMLTISHPRFDDRSFYIVGNPDNLEIEIPVIKMANKATQIQDLVIYAYKDPIYFKGDTLVYIADSFKVGPNAVVEDLLKKLPGIEVDSDGKIKSQGQEIKKVLVDGDEFFGSDPTIATKNLGAKAIESVQVYEKDDDGQFGSEDKIKVLDLKLKDDAKKGYFGKVSGASDFGLANIKKPFYEGEFLFNHFKSTQKISVFGLGTNTPRSNFGWGDANKFGLENEDTSGDPFGNPFANNQPSGIPKTWKLGIYFSDKVGKKKNTKIGFNYTYYNKELQANSGSRTQYFLSDTTYFTDDSTNNLSRSQSHIINFSIESQLDSLTKLIIKPSFRVDQQFTDNNTLTQYIAQDNVSALESFANNKNKSLGLDGDLTMNFIRKFKRPKRELDIDYYFNYIDNKTDGTILTRTNVPMFPLINDTVDQSKINYNSTMINNAFASYTEPFGKFLRGTIMYNFRNELLKQNRESHDFANGSYSILDSTLSNRFETTRNEHKAGLKLQFDKDKHMAFIRVDVRNVDISNINLFSNNNIHQNFTNVLPSIRYQYRASMSKQLRITYSTSSSQPSINDLQPIQDNSNPNRLTIGNPSLRPNYSHNLNAFFNSWNPMTAGFIWAGLNVSLTDNAFATSTSYDAFGRMITQTVNVNGNFNSTIFGGGGVPIKGRTIQFRPNILAGYSHFTNLINSQKNITDNLLIGAGGEFRFQWDSLEFNFGGRYDWNSPKSSLNSASSTPYGVQTYTASVTWRLPLGFEIKTDARYTINDKLSQGYNLNYLIWNASVSKNFLKTENLNLAIEAFDILNQSINAGRTVSGNMVVDNRTKIISRYFLLRLTYRFNNFKTRENEQKFPF